MKYKTTGLLLLVLTIGSFGLLNFANTLQTEVKTKAEATSLSKVNELAPATICVNAPNTLCPSAKVASPAAVNEADSEHDNEAMITPISRFIVLQ